MLRKRWRGWTLWASGLALLGSCEPFSADSLADGGLCAVGQERCECYANGTCNAGLTCLSSKCVDLSVDRDASLADAATAATASGAQDTEAATETTSGTDGDVVDDDVVDDDVVDDAANDEPEDAADDELLDDPTQDDSAQDDPAEDDPAQDDPAQDEAVNDDPANDEAVNDDPSEDELGDESFADEAIDEVADEVAGDENAQDESTEDEADDSDDVTDDTTELPPGQFVPLPERVENALDKPSTSSDSQASCPATLNVEDICRSHVACTKDEACYAQFEWLWAENDDGDQVERLTLQEGSGDGTVVLGLHQKEGAERSSWAYVWRWGTQAISQLPGTDGGLPTALNLDATAAVGTDQICDGPACEYPGVRWTSDGIAYLPAEAGLANDIADGLLTVGYSRWDDNILRGYVWNGAEPTYVQNLAIQKVSGDGNAIAGQMENGPITLMNSSSTYEMPEHDFIYAGSVLAVNRDGTLVVGYGWGVAGNIERIFRWHVGGELDVIDPLSGFETAVPLSITAEGDVMLGVNRPRVSSGTPAPAATQAFYWDEAQGLRLLSDELAARGLKLPADLHLHEAYVSADGATILGRGFRAGRPILWRARLAVMD